VSPAAGIPFGFVAVTAIYAVLTVLTVFVLRRLAHSHDVAAPQEVEEAVPS
jgi:cytochrome d ubiquinol oxidase subunit I